MIVMHSWACQMEHVVWSRHAKPGIVSPDVIFKAMRLGELFHEWAEKKHGQVPAPEEKAEIRRSEQ